MTQHEPSCAWLYGNLQTAHFATQRLSSEVWCGVTLARGGRRGAGGADGAVREGSADAAPSDGAALDAFPSPGNAWGPYDTDDEAVEPVDDPLLKKVGMGCLFVTPNPSSEG